MSAFPNARFVHAAPTWAALPDDGRPEVAMVGRSNVGKSSLLNLLLGRKQLAHTSGKPGKTQAFNFYLVGAPEVDQGGREGFYLVDLPGYGYAKVSQAQRAKWQQLIGRYVTEREPLRVVVHLIDSRHPPQRQDLELIELMRGGVTPYVIALTKADKLSRNKQQQAAAGVRRTLKERGIQAPIVLTSAVQKLGADELWQWIETLAGAPS